MLKRKQESRSQASAPIKRYKGDHLWNGCGSEAGQNERKPSVEPSMRIWKEDMRNQVGKKEESVEVRTEANAGKTAVR